MAGGIKEEKINPASAEGQVGNASGDPTIFIDIGSIALKLKQAREDKEYFERIKMVLEGIPHRNYHDGSLGVTHDELAVTVDIPNLGITFELAGKGHDSSNYAGSQTEEFLFGSEELKHLADMPVFVQLAYLYQKYKQPMRVRADYYDIDKWQGQHSTRDEEWRIEFLFGSNKGVD